MGQGREQLTFKDVLVVDEAGMIGSRQMERVLSAARDAGAKVVLVGDPEQLQAIEAGASFRALAERHGAAEITEIRRQREDWQRDATKALATGRTGKALDAYDGQGMVHAADTREAARAALMDGSDAQRLAAPEKTQIILTHTNAEVRDLNLAARERLRDAGDLGDDVGIAAERGTRDFAAGDRIMFLKNERGMGVKNGTLGIIEQVSPDRMGVRLDDGRQVGFDLKDYAHVDHGYAATVHKSQGVTVDATYVLATPGMDRHSAYVALSRHRDGVQLHYGRDDFADQDRLVRTLSRERAKDMASDYIRPEPEQARAFAERRGFTGEIRIPERVREIVAQVQEKTRSMFAGFRPNAPAPERYVPDARQAPGQASAITRYARATVDIDRMHDKGLPVLPHQEQALAKAGEALDYIRSDGARDLGTAFERNPQLAHDAAAGNAGGAAKAMVHEARVRNDPELRADRFVEQWQGMSRERQDPATAAKATKVMSAMIEGLCRDPALTKALESRVPGMSLKIERGQSVENTLKASIEIGRDRDRGMSMGW